MRTAAITLPSVLWLTTTLLAPCRGTGHVCTDVHTCCGTYTDRKALSSTAAVGALLLVRSNPLCLFLRSESSTPSSAIDAAGPRSSRPRIRHSSDDTSADRCEL